LNDADSDYLQLTYTDNEALSDTIVAEIEKARMRAFYEPLAANLFAESNIKNSYWANWWKVYGLGEVGSVQGVIFSNWRIVDNLPTNAQLKGVGVDFGFASDPTAIIELYTFDGEVYLNEVCYNNGLTNNEIANMLKKRGYDSRTMIVADCAEPKSIAEINRYGFRIIPNVKGAD
jgi:phage terminase large subunit